MSAAETLLSRLDGVRARSGGQWFARCPGPMHKRGDRSGGLGIKLIDDRVLINSPAPAGCTALEIVNAVGLDLRDLFDKPLTDSAVSPIRQPRFPLEMARQVRHHALVLILAAGDLKFGKALNGADIDPVVSSYREIDRIVS